MFKWLSSGTRKGTKVYHTEFAKGSCRVGIGEFVYVYTGDPHNSIAQVEDLWANDGETTPVGWLKVRWLYQAHDGMPAAPGEVLFSDHLDNVPAESVAGFCYVVESDPEGKPDTFLCHRKCTGKRKVAKLTQSDRAILFRVSMQAKASPPLPKPAPVSKPSPISPAYDKENLENGADADESEDEGGWTARESALLLEATRRLDPTRSDYWPGVAAHVGGRHSAEACFARHHARHATPTIKRTAPKVKEPPQPVAAISGGAGTLKRKRDMRHLWEHHEAGHEDDAFSSTPFKKFKSDPFLAPLAAPDDDDVLLGLLPASTPDTPSDTAVADVVSPEFLKPIDRDGMDGYINRTRTRAKSFLRANGGNEKPTKAAVPKKREQADSLTRKFEKAARAPERSESDEEKDEEDSEDGSVDAPEW